MKTLLIYLLVAPTLCFATLGKDRSSVQDDIASLSGRSIVDASSVPTHSEVRVDSIDKAGQTFHEYSDAQGNIFAITWHGRVQPDLSSILGSYFAEFKRLEDATPKGHRFPRRPFITSEITVLREGHLQDLHGIAFVNGRIPAGIQVGDLK